MIDDGAAAPPRLDRWFWLAVLIAVLVVLPRSLLITAAHSPTMDEQIHLRHGLSYLTGNPSRLINMSSDAPLGQVICALPMLATGSLPAEPMNPETMSPRPLASEDPASVIGSATPELMTRLRAARRDVLFGHDLPPETLRMMVSAWKALLFIPAAALVFHWSRRLYGLHAGWLAMALVLVDPTFAAHIPLATIDSLAVTGAMFACYFAWRLMERPGSRGRLVTASALAAAALLLKLNNVVLPVVIVAMVALFLWRRDRFAPGASRRALNLVLAGVLLTCGFIWVLTGFDFSVPGEWMSYPSDADGRLYADYIYPAFQQRWPAGRFVQILLRGLEINESGRWSYLLGQAKSGGWRYYFPVVASYKVPIGFFAVLAAAIVSVRRFRPRFDEWSLVIPLAGWAGMLLFVNQINTGFRHFLPAYVFILMLMSRCVARPGRTRTVVAWTGVTAALLHALTIHPDYLSYFNRNIDKPWTICNDSNVDWGQAVKQMGRWLDKHPTDRPVYVRYDWDPVWVDYYLGDRVRRLHLFQPPPESGLLIISPVWEAGYWDPTDAYAFLRPHRPFDVIGHSVPVYDLDAIRRDQGAPAAGPE